MFTEILEKRGLFRLNGKKAVVDQVMTSVHNLSPDLGEAGPFEIATALKRYLEETVPLIPFALYDQLIETQQIALPSARGPVLKEVLQPVREQDLICDLLYLFVTMCRGLLDASEKNQMDMNALCRIFGPLMVRPHPNEPRNDPNAKKCTAGFIKDLLRWYEYLFQDKEINLEGADKNWQRKRKRKTMQLLNSVKQKAGAMPSASQFFIIDPKQTLSVTDPKRERSGFVSHTTYLVTFGTDHCRRNYSDFSTLHFFLTKNYPTISFPNLPSKSVAKEPPEMARLLHAFLAYVCTQDELFMDSLFTTRWTSFFAAIMPDKDREKEIKSMGEAPPPPVDDPSSRKSPRGPTKQSSGTISPAAKIAGVTPISLGGSSSSLSSSSSSSSSASGSISPSDRTRSKQYKLDEVLAGIAEEKEKAPVAGDAEYERKKAEREQRLAEARRKRENRQLGLRGPSR